MCVESPRFGGRSGEIGRDRARLESAQDSAEICRDRDLIGPQVFRSNLRSRQISAESWAGSNLARSHRRPPPISPRISGSPHTSNARPARSGSSYGPIRPHRPLRHACRPAQTAERHERRSNGPSAAATAEETATDRTRSTRMTGSPPKLPAPTRPPNSSRSCVRRTADKLSRSHQLTSPKDLL